MTTRKDTDIQQRRLAHEIRTALDASADRIPADIAERLAAGRRIALARKKAEVLATAPRLATAGAGHLRGQPQPTHRFGDWMRRLALVWVMLTLMAGLTGIYHWQQQTRIDELADVDSAMLLDDLPPAAYADQGFFVFLKRDE